MSELSNLQQRTLVAFIGMGIFAGLLFSGMPGALFLFFGTIFLCMWEFCSLSPVRFTNFDKLVASICGSIIFLILSEQFKLSPLLLLFLPVGLMLNVVFSGEARAYEKAGWTVLGWIYLSIPWHCMMAMLNKFPYNPMLYFGLFGLLWMADSGAYFVGKKWGRTKLMPSVSPKKTWEGLAGGLVCSILLSVILSNFLTEFTQLQWKILAISTTVAGAAGDLAESRLKRSLDLKDSGSLLPGHGGFLDRFDGFFLAAPVNYLISAFFFG